MTLPATVTSPSLDEESGAGGAHRRGGGHAELDPELLVTDHNVVLAATAYASESAARRDFEAVGRGHDHGPDRFLAAAVLYKGYDGALTIDLDEVVEPGVVWGGALLGAALTVLAAPLGIALLPPVVTAPTGWTPVTALVTQFWEQVAQETLHRMSDLLESNPAGIVIVAIDLTADDVRGLLTEAKATIVADTTRLDSESAFLRPDDAPED